MRDRPRESPPERERTGLTLADGDKRYDAFISYSRLDERLAVSIQQGLHRVGRSGSELRALRVFRDSTDLHAGALASQIEAAMERSSFFILIASPSAAASKWVSKELEFWLERFGATRLLLVLADGELAWDDKKSCFADVEGSAAPQPLRLPASMEAEPVYVDFRQCANEKLSDPLFREQVVDLAAPVHGVSREHLSSEDRRKQRRYRRLRNVAVAGLAVLFVSAVAAALVARSQQLAAESQSRRATALGLSGQARALIDDDPLVALALSAEAVLATEAPTGESLATMIDAVAAVERQRWAPAVPPITVHNAGITQLALDPTGTFLVSSDSDGAVWLTDAATGEVRSGPVFSPGDAVVVLAMSPDGQVLAAGTEGGDVRVWDIAAGAEVTVGASGKHEGVVTDLEFSSDGEVLVSGGEDGTVRVRVLRTDHLRWIAALAPAEGGEVVAVEDVAFSPSGALIAATGDGAPAAIWETETGGLISRTDETVSTSGRSVAFSPDESMLATGHRGRVYIWERASNWRVADQELPIGWWENVDSLMFTENGSLTAISDEAVRHWNFGSGGPTVPPIEVHDTSFLDVAVAAESGMIVTADQNGGVRLWNPGSGQQIAAPLRGHTSAVQSVAVSATGDRVFSAGSDGKIVIWSHRDPTASDQVIHGQGGGGSALAFSPDGSILATGDENGSVRLRDASTYQLIEHYETEVPGRLNDVRSLEYSRDGTLLIAVDHPAFSVRYWVDVGPDSSGSTYVLDPDCVDSFNCWINGVRLDPTGRFVAISTYQFRDRNVFTLFDVQSGQVRWQRDNGTAFAFGRDGTVIAVAADDDVELRDVLTGEVLAVWRHALDKVSLLHVTPEDGFLAVNREGSAKVWDPDTRSDSDLSVQGGLDGFRLAGVSDDGPPTLAVASVDENTDILVALEIDTDRLRTRPVTGPIAELVEVAVSRDGELIATADRGGRVQLWASRTAEPIGQPLTGSAALVGGLSFSPTTDALVAVMSDDTMRSWNIPYDIASACDLMAGRIGLRHLAPYLPEGFEPQACVGGQ